MSEKLTRITIPGAPACSDTGLMDWGECDPAVMIAAVRRRADHMREAIRLIDSTPDEGFQIDVVRGSIVQHFVKSLQSAREAA